MQLPETVYNIAIEVINMGKELEFKLAAANDAVLDCLLGDRVLRDCTPRALPRASRAGRHVASLRTMTRQAVQRCTSALLPLNYPVHGAQGAPLQSNL